MNTLNMNEIEEVAGGFPIGALPLVVFLIDYPTVEIDVGASN